MIRTKKDVAKSVKTLLVMLQSCRNQQVTVTLRNDTLVRGTLISVDASMNIELSNAIVEPDLFYCTDKTSKEDYDKDNMEVEDKIIDEKSGESSAQKEPCVDNDSKLRSDKSSSPSNESRSLFNKNTHTIATVQACDYFLVKGSRIRHIDLPSDYDLVESTRNEIERLRTRRKQWTKHDIVRSS